MSIPAANGKTSRKSSLTLRFNHNSNSNEVITKLLNNYKKLEVDLSKFNSKHGILKTNILRVTLLPFLRVSSDDLLLNLDPKVVQSIISVGTTVLLKWWSSILASLKNNTHPVSIADRTAHLECISRIISRREWNFRKAHSTDDMKSKFERLLTETLEYAISRLNLKSVPLSISAFVGKVFAYSFFNLPKVSNALMFLLNVKQNTFESIDNLQKASGDYEIHSSQNNLKSEIAKLKSKFPDNVHYLIEYQGIPNLNKQQKKMINALPPPQHPVNGISDPRGSWVRKWCCEDSPVFNSFLRHYLYLVSNYLNEYDDDDLNTILNFDSELQYNNFKQFLLYNSPGFNVLLAHIYSIFNNSINKIIKSLSTTGKDGGDVNANNFNINFNSSNSNTNSESYNAIVKLFATLRDFLHNNKNENESLLGPLIVKNIDALLVKIATTTSAYDFNRNNLILNIVYELMLNVIQNGEFNSSIFLTLSLDWNFWISAIIQMLKTENIQVQLKAFSFLYNVWEMIPNFTYYSEMEGKNMLPSSQVSNWFIDNSASVRWNVATWLLSNANWEKFFAHWQPIIRSYYSRLVVWRMIGLDEDDDYLELNSSLRRTISQRLRLSYDCLVKLITDCSSDPSLHRQILDMNASSPIVNRKFVITPSQKDAVEYNNDGLAEMFKSSNEIRKIHSYEIFDDAIYTHSTTQPSFLELDMGMKKSSSLVNSIGKFFKKFSVDENNPEVFEDDETISAVDAKMKKPNAYFKSLRSVSLTSLSTYSRSSSPSIISSNSPPTSYTENSIRSSDSTDINQTSSSTGSNNSHSHTMDSIPPPPEMNKRAPEIIRPLYKFSVVFDQNLILEQLSIISNKDVKFFQRSNDLTLPPYPRMPKILIDSNYLGEAPPIFFNHMRSDIDSEQNSMESDSVANFPIFRRNSQLSFYYVGPNQEKINLKRWLYLGKALNEWLLIVKEFEDFVNKKATEGGLPLNTKNLIPLLVVEAPSGAKLLNAS